jgi:hypothetical protein
VLLMSDFSSVIFRWFDGIYSVVLLIMRLLDCEDLLIGPDNLPMTIVGKTGTRRVLR